METQGEPPRGGQWGRAFERLAGFVSMCLKWEKNLRQQGQPKQKPGCRKAQDMTANMESLWLPATWEYLWEEEEHVAGKKNPSISRAPGDPEAIQKENKWPLKLWSQSVQLTACDLGQVYPTLWASFLHLQHRNNPSRQGWRIRAGWEKDSATRSAWDLGVPRL